MEGRRTIPGASAKEVLGGLKCPICKRFFKKAMTINECMDTFCKRCIKNELAGMDNKACPVCKIELPPNPSHYLRKDHCKRNMLHNIMSSMPRLKAKSGYSSADDRAISSDEEETSATEGSVTNEPPPPSPAPSVKVALDVPVESELQVESTSEATSSSTQLAKKKNKKSKRRSTHH